jgi:integrase
LSLGYRKSNEGGAWVVRRYDFSRRRHLEDRIGTADDYRDADGADVLDFGQAQRKVLADAKQGALQASGQLYSVGEAVTDYVAYLRIHRKTSKDTASKLKTYVSPELARKRVAELTSRDLDTWLTWALRRRRRTKKPKAEGEPAARAEESSPLELADRQRRRKATLNRVINALKGCLNHAHAAGKVPSREAWARLKKFRSADSTRLRWLTEEEATRLQNACERDFRPLVRAALLTGCRAGELLALRSGDFDARSKTLLIADSKNGKPRRVPLTDEGIVLFEDLTAVRLPENLLFTRAEGLAWHRMAFVRAMRGACSGGKISPPATFHTLRHTYASHLVQAGVPLLFVASALGHSDTRMVEKHYGHLTPSQVADMIRANLPSFGGAPRANVRRMRRPRRSSI